MALQALQALKTAQKQVREFLGWEKGTNMIFVGNPGVGKSTLLNGLTGTTEFPSGVSGHGAGLTTEIKSVEQDGVTWTDSPGLADMRLRAEAATHIQRLLNKGGKYKIFFVVTLEAGRLRPADKLTIDEILNSAAGASSQLHYGVIINKMEPTEYANLNDEGHAFKSELLTMINLDVDKKTEAKNLAKSIYMFGLPREQKLIDQPTNNKLSVTDGLKKFIMSVPAVELKAGQAQEISVDFLPGGAQQQRFAEMEMVMEALKSNRDFMAQQAEIQQANLIRLEEQDEKRMRELEDLRSQLNDAQNRVNIEGIKMPRTEETPDVFDAVGDVAGMIGAPFGMGGIAKNAVNAIKGICKLF